MVEKRGLSENEAKKSLEKNGSNEIKDVSKNSPLKIFLRQIKNNFTLYLLVVATIISFIVGKPITAYAIIAVIILVVTLGFFQEYRAERVIDSLKDMLVPVSIVIRDGKEREILSKEIVPGDILVLRSGEKIPADCIILEEKELLVNESILTGEAKEVSKIAPKNEKKYSDENILFMGSFVINGKCLAKVTATGMKTKFGQISHMISTAEKDLPLQNKINKILKFMIIVGIIFAVLTGAINILSHPINNELLIESLILIIALCISSFPEGFPVVLITSLSAGAYRMAKNNAIVNRMSIIETLGETTIICSGKTGTITKGEMTVRKIFYDNKFIDISGVGYEGNGDFISSGKKIKPLEDSVLKNLINCSVLCNDSKIERTGEDQIFMPIGTPTEAALLVMAAKSAVHKDDLKITRLEEIPFNSERKIMTVLCKDGRENYVYSKGAPEMLIEKCKHVQRYNGVFTLTQKEKERILEMNKVMTSESLRTIALAYKKVSNLEKDHFEEDLILLGITGMEDPPKEGVVESISLCIRSGIKVKMITGDNRETAISIANKVGIYGKIMEGYELEEIDEKKLSKIVLDIAIFARVKPEHKLKIVKALKLIGEIVTMTGDGVNDAPALKEAHIGVAMGKSGTDVSRSVADLTLKDDHFSTIVTAVKEGRLVFKNIRKFVTYQLSCNFSELLILFVGALLAPLIGWQIPILLALQILFMNLVTDDLPAITLGLTPTSDSIMEEKPRKRKEILNKYLIMWLTITGAIMAVIVLFTMYITFNVFGQNFEHARTTALLTLVMLEIANAYNFISLSKMVSPKVIFANKYLTFASIISIIATIVIIYSPINKIFGTVPIGISEWLISIILSIFIILAVNLLKGINEKREIFKLDNY